MTEFELKKFQQVAVEELQKKCEVLLEDSTSGTQEFVFMAPTGSGKTIMCGEFLKNWVDESEFECSFIWIAPNKLDAQSKKKLEKQYVHDKILTPLNYEELIGNKIQKNQIFFVNWPRVFKTNNKIIVGKEDGKSLQNIVKNTKKEGRKIILIIDEGHNTAGGKDSQDVIKLIKPDLVIYVTATPGKLLANCNDFIKITDKDVKDSGMITKSICFNSDNPFSGSIDKKDIIKVGLDQRKKLVEAFKKEKTENKPIVNPLLLIQIPNRSPSEESMLEHIKQILRDEHKITIKSGKLAIYLADDGSKSKENKVNLEDIEDNDNKVEVMIFKQAIALGWDCPRASILCLFRDLENETFGIQVLGRLRRMPEVKHYPETEFLNHAYVYANFEKIKLKEDVKGMVEENFSVRDKKLWESCPITLERNHVLNKQKRKELTFVKFEKIFNTKRIQDKFNTIKTKKNTYKIMKRPILEEKEVEDIDKLKDVIEGNTTDYDATYGQIQDRFGQIVILLTKGFSANQSHHAIRQAIYKSLKKHKKLDITKDETKILEVVTSPTNLQIISECVGDATSNYKKKFKESRTIEPKPTQWQVPESIGQKDESTKKNSKYIMKPFHEENFNKLEKAFMEKISKKTNKVNWWYRNPNSGSEAFAIPYEDEGDLKEFFVDFIVKFKNGTVGLYDTKGEGELEKSSTKNKALALIEYMKKQNQKRTKNKLMGGIIANTDKRNYKGEWKINKDTKKFREIDKWDIFDHC